MKKNDLKECVKKLNDDELKYINTRLARRIGSDVGEVAEFAQRHQDIDRILMTAENANDFFDIVDQLDSCVQQESKRRLSR